MLITWQTGQSIANGRFTIQEVLGSGGFGITYKAEDSNGEIYAIKTLNHTIQKRVDFKEQQVKFINEASTVKGFRHPHIVKVYEVIQEGELFAVLMEYIEGITLSNYVQGNGRLTETQALKYIDQIAQSLEYIHKSDYLHRDVKPDNILLRNNYKDAVLIDFGLARIMSSQSMTNSLTHGFAPIEQYQTKANFGPHIDVYALGATLYYLLTATIPVSAFNRKNNEQELPEPIRYNPSISQTVNRAIIAAMAVKSQHRTKNIEEFRKNLGLIREVTPTEPSGDTPDPPVRLITGVALGLLTLAIITILHFVKVKRYSTIKEVPNVPNITVYYGGSTSFAALFTEDIKQKITKAHPGFKLEANTDALKGSNTGIKMLIEGKENLHFSLSSRRLNDSEIDEAKKKGFTLKEIPVAGDGIAFFVNRNLHIPHNQLDVDQVKNILTGDITNWNQVGGRNIDIKLFSRDPNEGTPTFLRETFMDNKQFGHHQKVKTTTVSIQRVASEKGGIGYATASEVCNQTSVTTLVLVGNKSNTNTAPCVGNAVNIKDIKENQYPITRKMYVIIKEDNTNNEKAGNAFANILLSNEGQKLVEEANLAPVHPEQ
jgi:serine/threonine protein kinase